MPTYRTKDGTDRVLPGIGRTINGIITTNAKIESTIFELVPEPTAPPEPPAVPAPAPQVAPPVQPQQTTNEEIK